YQMGLAFLSLLAGLAGALVITLLRLAIEFPLAILLPVAISDDFEHLSETARIALLCGGSLLLIVMFYLVKPERRGVGVTHVLQRMESHQGYLPQSNIVLQWFAAVSAIISGHSVGRE